MVRRSKFRLVFLPIGLFLFALGWLLYNAGPHKGDYKKPKTAAAQVQNGIEFGVLDSQVTKIPA
jgi:hypothetical protein